MSIFDSQGPSPDEATAVELRQHADSGAGWFFWIAGLSLVTSVISLTGGQWGFAISLGFMQIADAIAAALADELGVAAKAAAFGFDVIAAGVFVLFGVLARRRQNWAYLAGIVVYVADALIFLLAEDWVGLGFHGFALFFMIRGLRASFALAKLGPPQATREAEAVP